MKEYLEVLLYILTDTLEHTCGIVGSSKFNNMTSLFETKKGRKVLRTTFLREKKFAQKFLT